MRLSGRGNTLGWSACLVGMRESYAAPVPCVHRPGFRVGVLRLGMRGAEKMAGHLFTMNLIAACAHPMAFSGLFSSEIVFQISGLIFHPPTASLRLDSSFAQPQNSQNHNTQRVPKTNQASGRGRCAPGTRSVRFALATRQHGTTKAFPRPKR